MGNKFCCFLQAPQEVEGKPGAAGDQCAKSGKNLPKKKATQRKPSSEAESRPYHLSSWIQPDLKLWASQSCEPIPILSALDVVCCHGLLTPERTVTCNRSKQSLRISPVPFKKVPGLSAAGLRRAEVQRRQSTAFGGGETPYLCWFGHGLRLCRKHYGEERDPMRLPSPPFFPPNFLTLPSSQGRVCSPCSFPAASSPSG